MRLTIDKKKVNEILIITLVGAVIFKDILPGSTDQILVILLMGASVLWNHANIRFGLSQKWIVSYVILSYLICILSRSSVSYAVTLSFSMIVIFTLAQLIRSDKDILLFLRSFAVIGTFFCLYLIIKYRKYLGMSRFANNHMLSDTKIYSSIALSYYLIAISCCIIWAITESKNKKLKVYYMSGFIACIILIMFSGVRKAIFVPALFYCFWEFVTNRKNLKKVIKYFLIALLVGIIGIQLIQNIPGLNRNLGDRLLGLFKEGLTNDESVRSRAMLALTGLKLFFLNPLGSGFARTFQYFSISLGDAAGWTHPHNNYVFLLDVGGILFLLSYYWAHLYILVSYYKKHLWKSEIGLFIVIYILLTLMSDFGTSSYNIIYYNVFIGLGLHYLTVRKNSEA